jgi:glutaredoxin 3
MYATPLCPYCAAAKALLRRKGVTFQEIDVSADERRDDMVRRTGRRTVPQIFVGDHHVGGYDDLRALDERGELDPLLGIEG